MAIKTECRHCGEIYTLADHQRGKTVRCKSCGEAFEVRASLDEDDQLEETRVASTPTRRRGVKRDEEEDEERTTRARRDKKRAYKEDEDEDDERPVKSRRRSRDEDEDEEEPRSSGGGTLRILLAAGGVVALLCFGCVAAVGIWLFGFSSSSTPVKPPVAVNPPPINPVEPPIIVPQPPPPPPPVLGNNRVTKANLDRIAIGATPDDAIAILGEPTRRAGNPISTLIYVWESPTGGSATIHFRNNRLATKRTFNLP